MSNTAGRRIALAALLAVTVSAGCGVTKEGAQRPPNSTPSSTTSAAPLRLTLSEMAEHPCRALAEEQLTELQVLDGQSEEGGEQETGFRQCRWETAQGSLLFGPHPDMDMTADPRVAQLEPGELAGHRTLLGVDSTRDRCILYVAVTDQQSSFQVAIHPEAGQNLGMAGCDVIKQLASAILDNLA